MRPVGDVGKMRILMFLACVAAAACASVERVDFNQFGKPPLENGCRGRAKAYARYFDLYKHFYAWREYQWKYVYGVEISQTEVEKNLWDDFVLEGPFYNPTYEHVMNILHDASNPQTDIEDLVCDVERMFNDNNSDEYGNYYFDYGDGYDAS